MTLLRQTISTVDTDNATGDAFGRLRVANLETIFDSKQLYDNQPLFWDESLISGAGISSSHSIDEAATTITSTASTAGQFVRQTFMRFNYQPGKSQEVVMTGNFLKSGGGTGVTIRIGQFDNYNGVFFEYDAGTVYTVVRSNYTGTPVDTRVAQSAWSDPLDGTGASGITIDWTKAQIFEFDYQWLGVGRVRFGLDLDGLLVYVDARDNAGANEGVYMSTPNLPLRYELNTTSSSPATSMTAICSTVASEGGIQDTGFLLSENLAENTVNANTIGTSYALIGVRLKSTYEGSTIEFTKKSLLALTADAFLWELRMNPSVAGTFTYSGITNSSVEIAKGDTVGNPSTNTVTGGTLIDSGYVSGSDSISESIINLKRVGFAIDGTADEMVLCVTPLSANLDITASLTWKELN